ncbi:HAUS1 [Blepharisma stoltei]|uniref:HAUS augmin-like complex subunit 1 n=1 Tax=Blepharisma stoltei TaxID=1481888 RepID=A0AAU9I9H1_9CILI|nr:unnamed protein product [Blepharisma stoltei]
MIHPDQARSILDALNISKSKLSPQGQKNLEELAKIAYCLQINPACLELPSAVAEALITNSQATSQINSDIEILLNVQQSLKKSFLLLNKLKKIKSELLESTSYLSNNISSRLIPQKKELQARLQTLTPKWEIDEELRHESLLDLSEKCQETSRQAASLQIRVEMFNDIPPNIQLAQQKLQEAKQELARIDSEWTQKVNEMLQ